MYTDKILKPHMEIIHRNDKDNDFMIISMDKTSTFCSNVKCSILGVLLGYPQLFNLDNFRVAYTLVPISNNHHQKTCGLD